MWLLILTCFSYPITAVLISVLGLPSTPINIGLKFSFTFLAVIILVVGCMKSNLHFPKIAYFLVVFWMCYSFRLVYDISVLHVDLAASADDSSLRKDTASLVYSYFFGATFLPSLAIMLTAKLIPLKRLLFLVVIFLIIANISVAIFLVKASFYSGNVLFAERANVTVSVDGEDFTVLNTILIGYFGSQLVANALGRLLIYRQDTLFWRTIWILSIVLGIFNIFLAASRSPIVSSSLLIIIICFYNFRLRRAQLSYWIRFTIISTFLSIISFQYIAPNLSKMDFKLIERLIDFKESRENGQKEHRDYAFQSSIQDFLNSPVIGNQFVGTYDNFYPHNIFFEIPMATGLLGILPMVVVFFFLIRKLIISFFSSNTTRVMCSIIFLPKFISGLASGSLSTDPDLWILISFLISCQVTESVSKIKALNQ